MAANGATPTSTRPFSASFFAKVYSLLFSRALRSGGGRPTSWRRRRCPVARGQAPRLGREVRSSSSALLLPLRVHRTAEHDKRASSTQESSPTASSCWSASRRLAGLARRRCLARTTSDPWASFDLCRLLYWASSCWGATIGALRGRARAPTRPWQG